LLQPKGPKTSYPHSQHTPDGLRYRGAKGCPVVSPATVPRKGSHWPMISWCLIHRQVRTAASTRQLPTSPRAVTPRPRDAGGPGTLSEWFGVCVPDHLGSQASHTGAPAQLRLYDVRTQGPSASGWCGMGSGWVLSHHRSDAITRTPVPTRGHFWFGFGLRKVC
jgi:hypothetical protein